MFSRKHKELIDRLARFENLDAGIRQIFSEAVIRLKAVEEIERAVTAIIKEKTQGFPWLADAISQYHELRDLQVAEFLESKLNPARKAAKSVQECAREESESSIVSSSSREIAFGAMKPSSPGSKISLTRT